MYLYYLITDNYARLLLYIFSIKI